MSSEETAQALAAAIDHHQAGRVVEAGQVYEQILAADPNDPDAWHLLGVVAHQVGNHEVAISRIRHAIELNGAEAIYYSNLGEAYRAMRMFPDAIASYRKALELAPGLPDAHNNLGLTLQDQGEREEAVACYRRALELRPEYAEAHNNLGRALQDAGQYDEAIASYQRAVELKPGFAAAYNNLGTALYEQGRITDATVHYRLALEIAPDCADAHNNLAIALQEEGRSDEAALCCRQALKLKPDFAEALNNLGRALYDQGQIAEAMECYQHALELKPGFTMARVNLGAALQEQGRVADAMACFRWALELASSPSDVNRNVGDALPGQGEAAVATTCRSGTPEARLGEALAHSGLAMLLLATGEFEEGWREYEWRWRTKHLRPRPFSQPLWDGGPLAGRTILLHAEQGLGDTIHFVRYVPMVKNLGATVILECQSALLPLLAGLPGVDTLVGVGDDLPPFDVHAPLLSLPRILGTRAGNIPADIPYLSPSPQLARRWREKLEGVAAVKVGVTWQGNPAHPRDRHRSIRLAHFAPLARVPGVRLISLQKGPGTEQLPEVADLFPITDLGSFDEESGPFMDTAAIMANLDLVITSDTAAAHLAGALGVPVWVALPFCPDWRWMLEGEATPWYPTMRLFRQTEPGNWEDVFQRIAAALAEFVSAQQKSRCRSLLVETAPGELIDKITILRIKARRITDPKKLRNVTAELAVLTERQRAFIPSSERLEGLTAELERLNEALWDIEDEIRRCEARQDFGDRFIGLARSVYRTNDRRAAVKRAINDLLGSRLVEEKEYVAYEIRGLRDSIQIDIDK